MRSKPSIVHLGIYGKTAAKSLKLLIAGLREHINWQEKDPAVIGRKFTGDITDVQIDPSGEVTLSVKSDTFMGSWRKYNADRIHSSAYAKDLDVAYIKNWISAELLRRAGNVGNMEKIQLHPASKTSQTSRGWEVCATARALVGEDVKTIYGQKIFDAVVGQMADPVSTEVAEVIAEEAKRISREYKQKHQEMHMKMLNEIDSIRRRYKRAYAELGKQERAAITAMKKQMAVV